MKPMHGPQLSQSHYEALAELRYALRQFLRFSEKAAREAGLTPQQHQALLAIRGYPGPQRITIGDLAERLQILHHSAVGLVDRLQTQRYVQRSGGGTDRRHVHLAITARGESVLAELSVVHREQLQRIGPRLTEFLGRLRDEATGADSQATAR